MASGQFLLDSEASLSGLRPRPVASSAPVKAAPAVYESIGRVEQIAPEKVTLSHEAVPALNWPAMTMTFSLADRELARGLKAGDRVTFAFELKAGGPVVRRLSPAAAR